MIIYSDGKTTYSDGDSLSGDLGEKVRQGDKEALQKLKKFATDKDPEQPHSQARALYELAEVYFNGFCEVEKSATEALKFLIQAAELDDDLASLRLGKFYRDGKQGFKQDGQKALSLFIKAADFGNKDGLRLAAEMFREGKGSFKADGYKAIEFYEKLDVLDDKKAAFNIAEICLEGCGKFKPDGQRALEIYDETIRHGKYWVKVNRKFGIKSPKLRDYITALRRTAEIYRDGKAGVLPDGYKAIEILKKIIEIGDDSAVEEIATIYLEGKGGVEPDGYKVLEYLWGTEAAEGKIFINPFNAMKITADIWREGKGGVPQDGHKAVEYLKRLAENNGSSRFISCEPHEAFYELGRIYEEGCGEIAPDLPQAIEFYQKSADLGNYSAKMKLKELTGSDDE